MLEKPDAPGASHSNNFLIMSKCALFLAGEEERSYGMGKVNPHGSEALGEEWSRNNCERHAQDSSKSGATS